MNNASPVSLVEQMSAFADGELAPEAVAPLLEGLSQEDALRQDWHAFHVVGDVMRNAALAPSATDAAFWSRLEQKLAHEPARPTMPGPAVVVVRTAMPANQRWALRVGAALSVVAVTVAVGLWQQESAPAGERLAAAVPTAVVATAAPDVGGVMIRDPHLDALMQAHQQLGGHSAWQMPSGFLRNATYEEPPR